MDDPLDSAEKYLDKFDPDGENPVQALAWVLRLLIKYLKAQRAKL